MSKKIVEDSELQTLTLSPTNTDVDETSPFMHHTNETAFPPHTPPAFTTQVSTSGEGKYDKRRLEATVSAPDHSSKSVPSLRVQGTTTPGGPGYPTRVTYTNEKKFDLSKISRERPNPGNSLVHKKDASEVRQMEQGLLQLMDDFQQGNLRAFGKDSRLRQMEAIREQQERLARLHFDVGAEQDLYPPLSEEGLRTSQKNMMTLMEKLAQLSESIERLHTNAATERKVSDRKMHCQPSQTPGHHSHHHSHHNHHSSNTNTASNQAHLSAHMANNNVRSRTQHTTSSKNGFQFES